MNIGRGDGYASTAKYFGNCQPAVIAVMHESESPMMVVRIKTVSAAIVRTARGAAFLAVITGGGVSSLPGSAMAGSAPDVRQMSVANIVSSLMPSVVNVTTKRLVKSPTNAMNASSTKDTPNSPDGAQSSTSLGSGFVVTSDGEILTNNHVVEGAYDITATFQDGTILHADVMATTKIGDLALIKVHAGHKLSPVVFGDSSSVRVGDAVIAIGNPQGFGGSVSTGIVSALNRDIMLSPFDDFIQTDAALNHGNSGGPLFNLRGEVIGVTTALYTPIDAGGSIGIGFAIPSYCAQFVVAQLEKYGMVRAGDIGVQLQDVTAEIAQAEALPSVARTGGTMPANAGRGVIVTSVMPDGPAAQAGIQEGDILLSINQQPITDIRAFARTVGVHPLDQPITLSAWRNGQPLSATPVVREWKQGEKLDKKAFESIHIVHLATADLGLRLDRLPAGDSTTSIQGASNAGVLVKGVAVGSIASDRGLGAGDVIVKVMNTPVTEPDEVLSNLKEVWDQHKSMVMLLVRGNAGKLRWVPLPMPVNPT